MADLDSLISDMASATSAYLNSLADDQRDRTMLSFDDEQERRRWFYTPTPIRGLALGSMAPHQRQTVFRLLAVSLSEAGYHQAITIMGLERAVDYMEDFPDRSYGDLPNTRVREPDNYAVTVFGSPSDTSWSWRIGGHHLALQFTVHDGRISVTPAFFGAEPARMPLPGGTLFRALATEEDDARNLLGMLDSTQKKAAVICPISPTDIVQQNASRVLDGAIPTIGGGGPGGQVLRDFLKLTPEHDEMYRYTAAKPKGLPGGEMSTLQFELFDALVGAYMSRMAEPIARQYEYALEPSALEATTFAWAGPAEFGEPHYYRVQGPRLLIEYNCAQAGANHAHTVWRDTLGDFGEELFNPS